MAEIVKHRFLFEITEEQMIRANRLLSQYGLRKAIFGKILDDVLDCIETDAGMSIGILMSEKVVLAGIMSILASKTMNKKAKVKTNG
jgi:hypothetical protein